MQEGILCVISVLIVGLFWLFGDWVLDVIVSIYKYVVKIIKGGR